MMENLPAPLNKHWRIWVAGMLILMAILACNGSAATSVPPTLEPGGPTEEPPTEAPPTPTTGTINGAVEFRGGDGTIAPLPDTIVEIAGWENTYWSRTDAEGQYSIAEVPPGLQMVIPQANSGMTSYQAVNVVAGQIATANFRIISASPLTATSTIDATITVDGIPISGAYLWIARSNQVYTSNQNGDISFVYGSSKGSPVIVVYNDRWDILEVPFQVEKWNIELSRVGNPPPLPVDMVLVEEEKPVFIEIFLPTPITLFVLPDLQPQEDCISFEGSKAALEQVDGRWKIVVGGIWLLDFADNQQEAEEALKIIQYYGFNQQCFVGRPDPSMEYYLIDGQSPSGSLPGEDCIGFNAGAINVENVDGRWKITEGSHWLMDFSDQETEAHNAYNVIQKYQFNNFCFVGRPDPSLIYFRK